MTLLTKLQHNKSTTLKKYVVIDFYIRVAPNYCKNLIMYARIHAKRDCHFNDTYFFIKKD